MSTPPLKYLTGYPAPLQAQARALALELVPAAKEPEPRVPSDLRKALAELPAARVQWKVITPMVRRDFIQWLGTAKQAETRARRRRQ